MSQEEIVVPKGWESVSFDEILDFARCDTNMI